MNALMMGAGWSDVVSWLPQLLSGLKVSVELTIVSLLFGFPLGLFLALGVQAKTPIVRMSSLAVVEIGRGAPALVLLQFMYFGLPSTGLSLGSFAASVIALSWSTGAYTSEIIRAGLESVPHGQNDAVIALGLSRTDALRFVILPQGLRVAIPPLLGFAILVFQGTSLCFSVAVPELISRAYEIGANTFFYFPVLALAGLFYVAICMPASFLVSYVEHRSSQYARR